MGIWSVSEVVECNIVFDKQSKDDYLSCYQLENILIPLPEATIILKKSYSHPLS